MPKHSRSTSSSEIRETGDNASTKPKQAKGVRDHVENAYKNHDKLAKENADRDERAKRRDDERNKRMKLESEKGKEREPQIDEGEPSGATGAENLQKPTMEDLVDTFIDKGKFKPGDEQFLMRNGFPGQEKRQLVESFRDYVNRLQEEGDFTPEDYKESLDIVETYLSRFPCREEDLIDALVEKCEFNPEDAAFVKGKGLSEEEDEQLYEKFLEKVDKLVDQREITYAERHDRITGVIRYLSESV